MIPKGTALIIGGSEDRDDGHEPEMRGSNGYENFEILKQLLADTNAKKQKVEVITTASSVPAEMEKMYRTVFKKLGFASVGIMNIEDKDQARDKKFCERINSAHAVMFTGGDQFRLSTILGGTPCLDAIRERYLHDKQFIVAGTSAGAMVMPGLMIYSASVREAMLKDDIKLSSGLKLFDTCIIDTHFIRRGRFARLVNAVLVNPELLGIGLGEDTALKIVGYDAKCYGSGSVIIIDALGIGQTNIADAKEKTPIYVENLKVHVLTGDCKFSLKDRTFHKPANKKIRASE